LIIGCKKKNDITAACVRTLERHVFRVFVSTFKYLNSPFTAAGHPGLSLGISLQLMVTLVSLWGYLYSFWSPWSLSLGISLQLLFKPRLSLGISLQLLVTLVSLWGYLYSCWSPWSLSLWGYLYNLEICRGKNCFSLSLTITMWSLLTFIHLTQLNFPGVVPLYS